MEVGLNAPQQLYIVTSITHNLLKINMETVKVSFKVYWRFKDYPWLKVTKCKKIVNTKTGTILKQHTRGFFISDRYIKRKELNGYLEKIPKKEHCPF